MIHYPDGRGGVLTLGKSFQMYLTIAYLFHIQSIITMCLVLDSPDSYMSWSRTRRGPLRMIFCTPKSKIRMRLIMIFVLGHEYTVPVWSEAIVAIPQPTNGCTNASYVLRSMFATMTRQNTAQSSNVLGMPRKLLISL